MKTLRNLTACLVAVAILAAAAVADEITCKNGRKYSGKIVEETDAHVKIKTKFGGVQTVKRADIASIVKKASKADEYKKRLKDTPAKDAKAHYRLALWCKVERLTSQYRAQLKRVIAIDPNHKEARAALGYVRHDGKWYTKAALKKLKSSTLAKEMKAKGMVKYKGKWVSKEEKENLAKGLLHYEGKWVTKQDYRNLKKGLIKYEGEWVTKEEREKREQGLYRIGKKKWVTEAEANAFHADWDTPWKIRTSRFELTSNAPIKYVSLQKEVIDKTLTGLQKFCLGKAPKAAINVWVFNTMQAYNGHNEAVPTMYYAHHSNSYGGAFDPNVPAVVTYKNPTPLYHRLFISHGLGEAYMRTTLGDLGGELWFILGVGHYLGYQLYHTQYPVHWIAPKFRAGKLSVQDLIRTKELSEKPEWNGRFYDQAALLIYMLNHDPRFAEKFKKVRAAVVKGKAPSQALAKELDLKELDKALNALISSAKALEKPVKQF